MLLQQRHDKAHQGGLWEFSGGKIEPGESVYQALCRELWEELGITVDQASPLLCLCHDYPDLTVQLDVWLLDAYQGHPKALENQPLQWIAPENLIQIPILAADLPIIEALLDHC